MKHFEPTLKNEYSYLLKLTYHSAVIRKGLSESDHEFLEKILEIMPHIWDEINDIDHETLIHGDTFIPNIVFRTFKQTRVNVK
eukprot:UN07083